MTSRQVVVAIAVLSLSRSVVAQTEAAKSEAKAKLAEGGRLLDEGDADGALQRFQQAYAAYQSPKIFFNFGLAHRRMAHDVEALEWFQRFVDEAHDSPRDIQGEARQYIKELQARVASVEVACDVAGAEVFIDGQARGVTPLPRPLLVTAGPHQIVVQARAGGGEYTQRIEPERGGFVRVDSHLRQKVVDGSPVVPVPNLVARPVGGQVKAPAAEPERSRRWWPWAVLGGVVLVGALAIGVAAASGGGPKLPSTDYGTMRF